MEIISFRFQDFLSAFIILFAVIDITGLTHYYRYEAGRDKILSLGKRQSIRWLHSSPFCL